MRRVADPYLRERLADLEDLAERLLAALDGGGETGGDPARARSCWPAGSARRSCWNGTRAASAAW